MRNFFFGKIKNMKNHNIERVKCGKEHTVCLTRGGGVWSFGASDYGQLGQGNKEKEVSPRQIVELMGTEVSQVRTRACTCDTYYRFFVSLEIVDLNGLYLFFSLRLLAEIVTRWPLFRPGSDSTPSASAGPVSLEGIILRVQTHPKQLLGRGYKRSRGIKMCTLSEREAIRISRASVRLLNSPT